MKTNVRKWKKDNFKVGNKTKISNEEMKREMYAGKGAKKNGKIGKKICTE